jgi:ribonuclease HII
MLLPYYHKDVIEAGCDEAGRGCLAGPVFAAAVILPPDFKSDLLNDSKQLSERKRYALREVIEREALSWAVGIVSNEEIDRINILRASILAMHRALDELKLRPEEVIIDGNRFTPYANLPYTTIVKGDGKYMSIAAASILAKTYRDDHMLRLHEEYPAYHWDSNKGYPAPAHRQAIREHGPTHYHRMTFTLLGSPQLEFNFDPLPSNARQQKETNGHRPEGESQSQPLTRKKNRETKKPNNSKL